LASFFCSMSPSWPVASFRCFAAIRPLSERSGHERMGGPG
jgi:hypothetical protein